jgi:superfamily II DNA or RNA helicase
MGEPPDWLKYEHQIVKHHAESTTHKTYHWNVVPEEVFYKCGLVTDANKHRVKRLINKNKLKNKILIGDRFGADAIAHNEKENTYHILQMKFYLSSRVTSECCTNFTMNSCMIMKTLGYLYTAKDNLEISFGENIKTINNPDERIRHCVVPGNEEIQETSRLETSYGLRPYQVEAVDAVARSTNTKCLLRLITGTGKTLIASHIAVNEASRCDHFIFAAPLLVSVENLEERVRPFLPDHTHIVVDSEGTTDPVEIQNKILSTPKLCIYVTYKSLVNIISILDIDTTKTYLVLDEVHNVLNNKTLCPFANRFTKSLYLTATVPEELADVLEYETTYTYNIRDAIENNHLVDYTVCIPMMVEPTDGLDLTIPDELIGTSETTLCNMALYLACGMLRFGKRRCIAYMTTIDECKRFNKVVTDVFLRFHGLNIETWKMDCTTKKKKRKRIFSEFEGDGYEQIRILSNVRILNESVDIVSCDSEFVANVGEHTNYITTVQRLGRGLRLDPKNPTKEMHMFLWCDDLSKTVNSLSLLKQQDPQFHKRLKTVNTNYDMTFSGESRKMEATRTGDYEKFVHMWCLTIEERWDARRLVWAAKRTELGRDPYQKSEDADEKRLGQWQSDQRQYYKKKTLSEERVKALEAIKEWVWESTPFEDNLVQWAAKRTELHRDPYQKSEDADEKRLGQWQSDQRTLYKKGTLPEERVKALNATEGWVWEATPGKIITKPKSFEENRVKWAAKRTELGRDPFQNSKDADEKRLGKWQNQLRILYKKKKLPEERIAALNATEGWVWESHTPFEENLVQWAAKRTELGRDPSTISKDADEKRLAQWQNQLRILYKKKKLPEERVTDHQRTFYKKGTLSEERVKALNATDGWAWSAR